MKQLYLFNLLKNYKNIKLIKYLKFSIGLNINTILLISKYTNENKFFNLFRIKALNIIKKLRLPDWGYFELPDIFYDNLDLFSNLDISNNIDLLNSKLGLSSLQSNISISTLLDIIVNSTNVNLEKNSLILLKLKLELTKQGIIFLPFFIALKKYFYILKKYIGTVVSNGDNFFSALNSIIFSEGSFAYIPKYITCFIKLGTYFKIIYEKSSQFERTLLITSPYSILNYGEGCSAPTYYESQLHTAIVELIVKSNSILNYSTLQNWSRGTFKGIGGIYNLTTKRGICLNNSKLNWVQVEIGSILTWKYPCTILLGDFSISKFYSLSILSSIQIADTGGKMIHLGSNSISYIIAKSISLNYSRNIYRGLVKISPKAYNCKNNSQCNSLLIGNSSLTITLPYLENYNFTSKIQQEAYISNIQDEQIFLLIQRGYTIKKAFNIILYNFCEEITVLLPIEFLREFPVLLKFRIDELIN